MAIRVRQACGDDSDLLALIGAATFLEAFIEDIPGPAIAEHCAHQHSREFYRATLNSGAPAAAWLAEHASTRAPVGYALVTAPDESVGPAPGDIELKRIYLLSRYHGSGLAQQLMDAALGHARQAGAPRLLLGTYAGNLRAIAFYGRNGFRQSGTRQFRVGGEAFQDIVMARTL